MLKKLYTIFALLGISLLPLSAFAITLNPNNPAPDEVYYFFCVNDSPDYYVAIFNVANPVFGNQTDCETAFGNNYDSQSEGQYKAYEFLNTSNCTSGVADETEFLSACSTEIVGNVSYNVGGQVAGLSTVFPAFIDSVGVIAIEGLKFILILLGCLIGIGILYKWVFRLVYNPNITRGEKRIKKFLDTGK